MKSVFNIGMHLFTRAGAWFGIQARPRRFTSPMSVGEWGSAEIYVNGALAGSGGSAIMLPEGKYQIELKAAGYKAKSFEYNVTGDAAVNIKLEK